jgi:hypothetical protein
MVSQKVYLLRCAALLKSLRALRSEASCPRPIMGVRPDAPTIEDIVSVTFGEIISIQRVAE